MAAKSTESNSEGDAAAQAAKPQRIFLVDGSGYIFRAYYGLPPLPRKSDGLPVGAVSGFCNMLNKLLDDALADDDVAHLAVIFDTARRTFRSEIYPDYKANRPPVPEDLIPQFPLVRDATRAFNVPCIEMDGYEADDLIATYADKAVAAGYDVVVVSSDKDLMQLVGDHVSMHDPMKQRIIGEEQVMEKFGVGPDKVIDVQALAGDSSDNVPGVPGIGVKTAAELINTYGDMDTVLDRAEEIKQPKRRQTLIENAELARVSRELVTLKRDVPVKGGIEVLEIHPPDPEILFGFLDEMEFARLSERLKVKFGREGGEDAGAAAPSDEAGEYVAVQSEAALAAWGRGGGGLRDGDRGYGDHIARRHAGGPRRRVPVGGTRQGLLCAARAHGSVGSGRSRPGGRPGPRRGRSAGTDPV